MTRHCPGCKQSRRFLRTDRGWVCSACSLLVSVVGEVHGNECPRGCGAVIEGLGASAHTWGNQHHAAECGGKGK